MEVDFDPWKQSKNIDELNCDPWVETQVNSSIGQIHATMRLKKKRMVTSWFDKIFEKMQHVTYGFAISDQFLWMGTVLKSFTNKKKKKILPYFHVGFTDSSKVHDSQYSQTWW